MDTYPHFSGLIDEVKIYNRTLNATEIQQIYQYDADNCQHTTKYNLTMLGVDPLGSGTTTPASPGTYYNYDEGEIVSLTAQPNTGYLFDHWTGDVADPNSAITSITMDDNKIVQAYFIEESTPSAGEVAYFEFEGNYVDEWGGDDSGTPSGNPNFGTGQCGQGVVLDAAENDHVDVPDENLDFEAPDHTLMAWINLNDWAGSNRDVIFANSGIQWMGSFTLYRSETLGVIRLVVRDTSAAGGTWRDVRKDVSSLSGWHHVAAVISTQNPVSGLNYMELYIDGSNTDNSYNYANNPWTPATTLDFRIGKTPEENNYLDGIIDEVKIFNRTLSQAEIVAEMACP